MISAYSLRPGQQTELTTATVRNRILSDPVHGLQAVLRRCREIERQSLGVRHVTWRGRNIAITWHLSFDQVECKFTPRVQVETPDDPTSRNDPLLKMLTDRVQSALGGLPMHMDVPFEGIDLLEWVPELCQP